MSVGRYRAAAGKGDVAYSSDNPQETEASPWKLRREDRKWSGRASLLFIVVASLVCWGLLIGKAVLIL